jgi:hypothetical protein
MWDESLTQSCTLAAGRPMDRWQENPAYDPSSPCHLILYHRGTVSCTNAGECTETFVTPTLPEITQALKDRCCGGKCYWRWTAKWNCTNHNWDIILPPESGCGTYSGTQDAWVCQAANCCTQTYVHHDNTNCFVIGDCPSAPAAPSPPSLLDAGQQNVCCNCSGNKCFQKYVASYNCDSHTWSGPTISGLPFCGGPATPVGWKFVGSDGITCNFEYVKDLGQCCTNGSAGCPRGSPPPGDFPDTSLCHCGKDFCYVIFYADYDCDSMSMVVTRGATVCLPIAPIGWNLTESTGTTCRWIYYEPTFRNCEVDADCPDGFGGPPSPPDPSECPCNITCCGCPADIENEIPACCYSSDAIARVTFGSFDLNGCQSPPAGCDAASNSCDPIDGSTINDAISFLGENHADAVLTACDADFGNSWSHGNPIAFTLRGCGLNWGLNSDTIIVTLPGGCYYEFIFNEFPVVTFTDCKHFSMVFSGGTVQQADSLDVVCCFTGFQISVEIRNNHCCYDSEVGCKPGIPNTGGTCGGGMELAPAVTAPVKSAIKSAAKAFPEVKKPCGPCGQKRRELLAAKKVRPLK